MLTPRFLEDTFGRKMCLLNFKDNDLGSLFSWSDLNALLVQQRLGHPRIRLFKDEHEVDPARYFRCYGRHGAAQRRRIDPYRVQTYLAEGATLTLDALDEASPRLRALATAFEAALHEHVQINAFLTPPNARSAAIPPHIDNHDVFALQIIGRKRWQLFGRREVSLTADDLVLAVPPPVGEPVWEGVLHTGEVLYFPRGWWHSAANANEWSLHLTIGVQNRTGLDLLAWLREQLIRSPAFRADLPRFCRPEERDRHFANLTRELILAWERALGGEFFGDLQRQLFGRERMSLPWAVGPLEFAGREEGLRIEIVSHLAYMDPDGGKVGVIAGGRRLVMDEQVSWLFRWMHPGDSVQLKSLYEEAERRGTPEVLLLEALAVLIRTGVVAVTQSGSSGDFR